MKKIIISAIIGLFVITGLKAQNVTIPTYTSMMVILKTSHSGSGSYLTLSDGTPKVTCYEINPRYLSMKKEETDSYLPFLTDVMNQLVKQGYKIQTASTSAEEGIYITIYTFQKE